MYKRILITLIGLSLITTTLSQNIFKTLPDYLGFNLGYSVMDDFLPESVYYSPTTFLISVPVWKKNPFSIYSELQFAKASGGYIPRAFMEFGLNMGFMYQLSLSPGLKFTAALSTGPHYITINTSRQDSGFIFSDNLELGMVYFIADRNFDVNLKARYRHISNAGLKSPNGGIDNVFITLGITQYLF